MTDTQRDRLLLLTADLLLATLCPSPPSEPRTRRDALARELVDLRAQIAARTALEPLQPMQAEPWQAVLDRAQLALQDGWTALHAAYRKPAGEAV